MNYFDNENEIIDWLQRVDCSSVCFPVENEAVINMFKSIYDEENWKKWINSSGKNDPPPDFFCDELKLMMDVMRVDDHSYMDLKGKVKNPTNARESKIQKEIKETGILNHFPNVNQVVVNAITDLPTDEDHNYVFYKNNFIRTIEAHKRKIELYKKNHLGYKIIFFVMDESTAYIETGSEKKVKRHRKENEILEGMMHLHFLDNEYIKTILNSEIDYLIWYTPFKHVQNLNALPDLPEVVVIDVQNYNLDTLKYKENLMISSEI